MAPKGKALARATAELIRAHHEAFAVELLGPAASGVPPERIQELLERGVIDRERVTRVRIRVAGEYVDPLVFLRLVGRLLNRTDPAQYAAMRQWDIDRWTQAVAPLLEQEREQMAIPLGGRVSVQDPGSTPPGQFGPQPLPEVIRESDYRRFERLKPPPPNETPPPLPQQVDTPAWLSNNERAAYVQALHRGGEFIRGLGNNIADQIENTEAEEWNGEDITREIDPEKREGRLQIVRQLTAQALAEHWTPRKLASELGRLTEDWNQNWGRVAQTELQGVYNEGRALDAIDAYGSDAQVARIPESGACDNCKRLFLRGRTPIIFRVAELLENGTNVGRKEAAWVATLWPIHPFCRCDTVVVPPGMVLLSDGRLRKVSP